MRMNYCLWPPKCMVFTLNIFYTVRMYQHMTCTEPSSKSIDLERNKENNFKIFVSKATDQQESAIDLGREKNTTTTIDWILRLEKN